MKEIIVESKEELTKMAKILALYYPNLKWIDNNYKITDTDFFLCPLKKGLYNLIKDEDLEDLVQDGYLVKDISLVKGKYWQIIYDPDQMNYFIYKEILYKPKNKEIIIVDSQEELQIIAQGLKAKNSSIIEYITDSRIQQFRKLISGYPDALEFLNFYKGPGFYWITSEKEIKLIYQYGDQSIETEHIIYKLKEGEL